MASWGTPTTPKLDGHPADLYVCSSECRVFANLSLRSIQSCDRG